MANSAGGARALERSLGRAGGVRAQPSSPEYVLVVRPLKGGTKLSRSICIILVEEGCARTPPARPRDLSRARAPPAELAMGLLVRIKNELFSCNRAGVFLPQG